jgi:hypothetical protein
LASLENCEIGKHKPTSRSLFTLDERIGDDALIEASLPPKSENVEGWRVFRSNL